MALTGCNKKTDKPTTDDSEREELVELTTLHPREIQRVITLSGNLEGYQTVNVAPSLTGKIEHIYVEVGDRVRKNDSLVRMDQQQFRTASLTYNNLQIEMSRMDGLIQTGSVSQQSYDQMKLSLDQTKENLAFLTANTYVRAPFSGVISAKNYEDGELYSGQPIVVLKQVDKLKTQEVCMFQSASKKRKGWKKSLSFKRKIQLFALFRPSTDWMRPTHFGEINLV